MGEGFIASLGLRQLTRHRLGRRGSTALEFAFIALPAVSMLFMVLAIGIIGLYQQVLDNAVRDVTRQVQINAPAASGSANFVSALCLQLVVLTDAASCAGAISYSVQASPLANGFSGLTPASVSMSGQLPNMFFSGAAPFGPNTNIVVQVCWQLPFNIPFASGLMTQGTGGSCLYGIGAARVEPYQ